MKTYIFRQPDNWHVHLREAILLSLIANGFNIYGRVLCIGNLEKLIETESQAFSYKQDILNQDVSFEPVMCIMLTQDTTPEMIYEAARRGIKFVKFIPVGTSTGASKGLRLDDYFALFPIFGAIVETGMHLLVHAELISYSGHEINLLDREERAIVAVAVYHRQFSSLKITIEHVSTAKMIDFIERKDSPNLRATLTPQHAIFTCRDVFDCEGHLINPLNYCLPVAKHETDRQAVERAMISGDERFFYGTDSAAHWLAKKFNRNPPPGVFFGKYEYLRTLEIFERVDALNKFEDFTSRFGAEYYGYPLNTETITVVQKDWKQPVGLDDVGFCMGGDKLRFAFSWSLFEFKK